MEAKKVLFIYNPASGQGKVKTCLSDIIEIFMHADMEVLIYATQAKHDAVKRVEEKGGSVDRIICCGGGGTLDEVVTGVMRTGLTTPIGYLPAGSANDFGTSLGIGMDMHESAAVASSGSPFSCDVGHFNEDYFVYVAAFGLFTEASYSTSQDLKNVMGYMAYILEGAKDLMDIRSYHLEAECDGERILGDYVYGMITNSEYIGGVKGLVGQNVGLDDGLFEITLVSFPKNPIELTEILGYFTGLNRDTKLVYSAKVKRVSLRFSEEVPWTLDGEYGGRHREVEVEVLPAAVELLI